MKVFKNGGGCNMYFITKEEDLVGKEIAFTHMNTDEFAEGITIVTKDNGIFIVEQLNGDFEGIFIIDENQIKSYILRNDYLKNKLLEKGIVSNEEIKEYDNQLKLEYQKQQKIHREKIYSFDILFPEIKSFSWKRV